VTVLAPTIGSSGTTDVPAGGAVAAAGSYSADLFSLKAMLPLSSCVPATFAARSSPNGLEGSGSEGPLTVARLLRLSPAGFGRADGGRLDLAINETFFGIDRAGMPGAQSQGPQR